MGQELSTSLGSCFYVISGFIPASLYDKLFGGNLDKKNPSRANLSKYEKDKIDQELVIAIRGETTADGKWTTHAEADDVRKLIAKGAANTHRDRAGGTPLHECCHMGLTDHARAILETYPEDALKKDRFGRTPMQYAIEAEKLDAVEMLLEFHEPVKLEIYKWIAINRTDFEFATKVFNALGNDRFSSKQHTV